MSQGRRNTKRKAFSRWQQLKILPGGLALYPRPSIPPMPMHIPLLSLTRLHCFLLSSHFSLHAFLNHFPVSNSHKNVFIEYILGEGTGPSPTEDTMNSSYRLATDGWGLNRDLNCIKHMSDGRGK